MRIAVTGGTGFVGSAIVSGLLEKGHEVTVLARKAPDGSKEVRYSRGNVVNGEGLADLLEGKDALIHLVGIIREVGDNTFDRVHRQGTENVVRAALDAGTAKLIHMSALGTRPDGVSHYHRSKWAGEQAVRNSGLDWTIFRPSIIYGPSDSFINMLAGMIRRSPVIPVIGGGQNLMQPVFVGDVARAFSEAVSAPWSSGMTYELGGPDVLKFKNIVKLISEVTNKKRIYMDIPVSFVRPVIGFLGALGANLPITTDQLIMMQEDNVCIEGDSLENFSFDFTPFREGIESYLRI